MANNPNPSSPLPDVFSPATRDWFLRAFKQPTAVQPQTWHVAARSEHALVIAPTGSGKTLAAFLYALDRLFREPRLRFTLTEVNDLPVRQTPMFTRLREAGFSSSPQGLDWG